MFKQPTNGTILLGEEETGPSHHRRKPWMNKKFMLIAVFLGLVLLILFTSFFPVSLTGYSVYPTDSVDSVDYQEGIPISADLTVPDLTMNEKLQSISIVGAPNSFFFIDNKKISLPDSGKIPIDIENFEGEIIIDESTISLDGVLTKISTKNIPITSKSDDEAMIAFEGTIPFYSLVINNAALEKLSYRTTGTINVEKETRLAISDENVTIDSFHGKLEINKKRLKLDGVFEALHVTGKRKISFSI